MQLRDQKVIVLGAARSGVASAKVLKNIGADVIVTDSASSETIAKDIAELEAIQVPVVAGGHPFELLDRGCDLIVKNPGIPPRIPFLEEARRRNIPIISEVELAYMVNNGHIMAITASNGKTTTTTLLGEILKLDRPDVRVAGNIGIPLTLEAAGCSEDTWLVAEMSSFQLNDIRDFRPEVAAVLNIMPAHIDWHGDFEAYLDAKTNVLRNQESTDTAVLNADNAYTAAMAEKTKAHVLLFSRKRPVEEGAFVSDGHIIVRYKGQQYDVIAVEDLGMGYAHNVENVMAATLMALAVGASLESIRQALRTFPGLPHRFQVVSRKNDRIFINDSKATNPGASEIAITLPDSPIVLIAGGLDRNIDLTSFAEHIVKHCHGVVLIGQTTARLETAFNQIGFTNYQCALSMEEAVPHAYALSNPGDTVLLSTGCASWDMYDDYTTRGFDFMAQIEKIPEA